MTGLEPATSGVTGRCSKSETRSARPPRDEEAGPKGSGAGQPSTNWPAVVAVARDWLRAICQEPDWDLVLDARGNIKGRISDGCKATDAYADVAAREAA